MSANGLLAGLVAITAPCAFVHPVAAVGIGAIAALWAVTLLAAYSGQKLGGVLKPKLLDTLLGLLFGAIGIYIIYTALR